MREESRLNMARGKPDHEREEEREKKRENVNQERWLEPKDQETSLTK